MATSQVFSGARAQFKIDGDFVGYSLGCTGVTGINYTPVQALGHLEVLEHVPTAYTVEMTSNLSRIASVTRLAPGDLTGTPENLVKTPQLMPAFGPTGYSGKAILESGELKATIYDRVLEKTIYTITGCKASQKSWDATAAGAVAENITWVAKTMSEEGQSEAAIGL